MDEMEGSSGSDTLHDTPTTKSFKARLIFRYLRRWRRGIFWGIFFRHFWQAGWDKKKGREEGLFSGLNGNRSMDEALFACLSF